MTAQLALHFTKEEQQPLTADWSDKGVRWSSVYLFRRYSDLPKVDLSWTQHIRRWLSLRLGFYTMEDELFEILAIEIRNEIDAEILRELRL